MGRHGDWPEGDWPEGAWPEGAWGKVPGLIPDRRATVETAAWLSPDAVAGIKQTMRRTKASLEGVARGRRSKASLGDWHRARGAGMMLPRGAALASGITRAPNFSRGSFPCVVSAFSCRW